MSSLVVLGCGILSIWEMLLQKIVLVAYTILMFVCLLKFFTLPWQ